MKIGSVYVIYGTEPDCNTYVIKDSKNCMIDPGLFDKTDELKKIGLKKEDINIVINTHCHYDHTAMNNDYENAIILAHPLACKFLKTGSKECAAQLYNTKQPICNAKPIDREVNLGKTKLKVMHTPGHTEDSICLYDKQNRILISGDLVFKEGIGTCALPTGNMGKLEQSIAKISKLNVEHILPGHYEIGDNKSIRHALEFIQMSKQ